MSHVVVIGSDLRRATVKVSPGTYLADVLQEACKKLNVPSDKYLLKHKQKQVDLSIVWRVSGLTPGAKLELVQKSKTPSVVSVALQLPDPEASAAPNGRLIEKFPSDYTVWQVLRQFESGAISQGQKLNLTARGVAQTTSGGASGSGQMYYETPVLNTMGRELASFDDFQKTLSQLGYNSGSVLIRLSFRKTERTLFEAMGQISQFFSEGDAEAKKMDQMQPPVEEKTQLAAVETSTQPVAPDGESNLSSGADISHNQQHDGTLDQEQTDLAKPAAETVDNDRPDAVDSFQPVNVFRAPSGTTPSAASMDVPEDDFAPTIAHAQLHQARLQQNAQNKRLLSDKELEAQRQAEEDRLASVTKVSVKVRFPDNTSAQWTFGPEATGATIYQAVRYIMAQDTQAFRLVIPGSKDMIKDDNSPKHRLIHDYKLTRSVLLSLVWNDSVPADVRKKPFLKGSVAERATDVTVPDIPKGDYKDQSRPTASSSKADRGEGNGDSSVAKKLPKWLRLPGKK